MFDINLSLQNEYGDVMEVTATVDLYAEAAIEGSRDEEPVPEYVEVLSVWACNHELIEYVDEAAVIAKIREGLESDFDPEDF